ncbi:MAG: hypothetical protein LBT09_13955 [Planctomycetaceae bacterium]|nr:hypothetical protein [Planctomycetaceae bacterium]
MKDEKFNRLIVMIWRFVSTGLVLVFLTCLFGSGCAGLGNGNKSNKSGIFSLPSYTKSTKTKSQKSKKAANTPKSLDEILGLPRS